MAAVCGHEADNGGLPGGEPPIAPHNHLLVLCKGALNLAGFA